MTKNARWLLTFFEEYYGEKYTGVVLDVTINYLAGYPESFYKAAASVIIKRFSRTYNRVPDIAVFEKNMWEILEVQKNNDMKNALPEPKPEITDEDREMIAQMLAEYKQAQKEKYKKCEPCKKCARCKKKPGPMAGLVSKALEAL